MIMIGPDIPRKFTAATGGATSTSLIQADWAAAARRGVASAAAVYASPFPSVESKGG